jgi:lipoate-protein ligase A
MINQFRAHFTVRHGEIQSAAVSGLEYQDFVDEASQDALLSQGLVKKRLHHINDWIQTLTSASPVPVDAGKVGEWLNYMFGIKGPREEGGGAGQSAVDALDVAGSLPQEIR